MLAGERFSDHPRCADPVVAAFLRAFNDRLDHHERQRLLPYAARVVGSRAGRRRRHERMDACLAFAGQRSRLLARLRLAVLLGARWALRLEAGAGELAARTAIAEHRVEEAFGLLDRLVGAPLEPPALAGPVVVGAELRVPGARAQLELEPH